MAKIGQMQKYQNTKINKIKAKYFFLLIVFLYKEYANAYS